MWGLLRNLWDKYRTGLLVGVTITAGLALVIFHAAYGTKVPSAPVAWTKPWFIDLFGKLGELLLVGGFIGAVTRYLAMSGVFREALSDIVLSDSAFDQRNDLPQVWQRLTKRIYLPKFSEKTDEEKVFAKKVHDSISSLLKYDNEPDFYVKNAVTTLDIRWNDEDSRVIEVVKTQDFSIIPFVSNSKVKYENFVSPTSGMTLRDYFIQDKEFFVDGHPINFDQPIIDKDGKRRIAVTLHGSKSYHVRRVSVTRWNIDNDPYIYTQSVHVMDSPELHVYCRAEGLTTSFLEIGMSDRFTDYRYGSGSRGQLGDQHRKLVDKILLPGQGYVLIFTSAQEESN